MMIIRKTMQPMWTRGLSNNDRGLKDAGDIGMGRSSVLPGFSAFLLFLFMIYGKVYVINMLTFLTFYPQLRRRPRCQELCAFRNLGAGLHTTLNAACFKLRQTNTAHP